jgi:hypothetical protein
MHPGRDDAALERARRTLSPFEQRAMTVRNLYRGSLLDARDFHNRVIASQRQMRTNLRSLGSRIALR